MAVVLHFPQPFDIQMVIFLLNGFLVNEMQLGLTTIFRPVFEYWLYIKFVLNWRSHMVQFPPKVHTE